MHSYKIIRILKWLFFAVVIGVPLFYTRQNIYPYAISKTAFFQIIAELIFFLWLVLAISDKRYRPKLSPIVWAISAYLGVLVVASFLGVDSSRSFWSTNQRAFGVVALLHLGALAIVAYALTKELPWKKIWYASFATSIAAVFVGALQLSVPNLLVIENIPNRPGSTFGNPGFLAGYLLFNVFLAGYYLLNFHSSSEECKKNSEAFFLWATVIIGVLGIFIGETRGAILGVFVGGLVLLVCFALRPPETRLSFLSKKSFYVAIIAILVFLSGMVWITRFSPAWNNVSGINRLKNLSFSDSSSDTLLPRIIAANAAWKGFLDRPFIGWGPENFNVAFNKYYDPRALEFWRSETNFDKPHNFILEELVAGGIFLLAAYLFLLVSLVYMARKSKDVYLFQISAAAVAAYFVQNIFFFDTLGQSLMFFLVLGFVGGKYSARREPEERSNASNAADTGINGIILICLLVFAAALIYFVNITTLATAGYQFFGFRDFLSGDVKKGIGDFHSAIDTWSPYQSIYIRDYANIIAQAYFHNKDFVPKDEVALAIENMERVAREHQWDAQNHFLLINIYNLVHDIDPEKYLSAAEEQAAIAFKLSPNRQKIYYYLSRTKMLKGDSAAAMKLAKTAIDLDPKVADSHFHYGTLALENGDNELGHKEIEKAVSLGYQLQEADKIKYDF
ncbi:MAG: O-antigen ligase family protein [Patescibacteria group bacterium]